MEVASKQNELKRKIEIEQEIELEWERIVIRLQGHHRWNVVAIKTNTASECKL